MGSITGDNSTVEEKSCYLPDSGFLSSVILDFSKLPRALIHLWPSGITVITLDGRGIVIR